MYSVHDWAEVHRLHERGGWSKTAIARKLQMSRNTVDRLLGLQEPPSYEGTVSSGNDGGCATYLSSTSIVSRPMLEAFTSNHTIRAASPRPATVAMLIE